jgi:hypothetical protein
MSNLKAEVYPGLPEPMDLLNKAVARALPQGRPGKCCFGNRWPRYCFP